MMPGSVAGVGVAPRLAQAKDSGFKIMMTPKWTGFPYFELTGDGAKAAAKELGDTVIYAGADHAEVSLQVETLQNFVTQKPDAIILAAIDLNAVAPVLVDAELSADFVLVAAAVTLPVRGELAAATVTGAK